MRALLLVVVVALLSAGCTTNDPAPATPATPTGATPATPSPTPTPATPTPEPEPQRPTLPETAPAGDPIARPPAFSGGTLACRDAFRCPGPWEAFAAPVASGAAAVADALVTGVQARGARSFVTLDAGTPGVLAVERLDGTDTREAAFTRPATVAALRTATAAAVAARHDGVIIDSAAASSFDAASLAGFRAYLNRSFDDAGRAALGVTDAAAFDYAADLRARGVTDDSYRATPPGTPVDDAWRAYVAASAASAVAAVKEAAGDAIVVAASAPGRAFWNGTADAAGLLPSAWGAASVDLALRAQTATERSLWLRSAVATATDRPAERTLAGALAFGAVAEAPDPTDIATWARLTPTVDFRHRFAPYLGQPSAASVLLLDVYPASHTANTTNAWQPATLGAARLLADLQVSFDVAGWLTPSAPPSFKGYDYVVVPDAARVTGDHRGALEAFAQRGLVVALGTAQEDVFGFTRNMRPVAVDPVTYDATRAADRAALLDRAPGLPRDLVGFGPGITTALTASTNGTHVLHVLNDRVDAVTGEPKATERARVTLRVPAELIGVPVNVTWFEPTRQEVMVLNASLNATHALDLPGFGAWGALVLGQEPRAVDPPATPPLATVAVQAPRDDDGVVTLLVSAVSGGSHLKEAVVWARPAESTEDWVATARVSLSWVTADVVVTWRPPGAGAFELYVQASDLDGRVQPWRPQPLAVVTAA